MITIGITGGIGSGKSTVAELWRSLGAYVLHADDVAKRLMVEDPEIRKEIVAAFGRQAYHKDGSLNRVYLAEEAFAKGKVRQLNTIVHPRIPAETKRIMDWAEREGYPVFIYEAALLLQKGRPDYLDYIVLVLADEQKRLRRVISRDETDRQSVADRMDKQQDFSRLKHLADVIIENNGTLHELKSKAGQYYKVLTESKPDKKE